MALEAKGLLAASLGDIGQFDEAVRMFRELAEDLGRLYGPDSTGSLTVAESLARLSQD